MTMGLALLFPGQASQHPDMLKWVDGQPEAADTMALLSVCIGADWRRRMVEQAWANSNQVAQCLLTGISLAAWSCLAKRLPRPGVIAGYSVGELSAFSVAGIFNTETALALARQRAELMDQCVIGIHTGLLAVTGAVRERIDQTCRHHGLSIAIDSGPDRWILGGLSPSLDAAAAQLSRQGVRCQHLAVSLASHTPHLLPAVSGFDLHLRAVPFGEADVVLICNRSGAPVRGETAQRRALVEQIAHTVRWSNCMDSIAQQRPSCVLEVGAGSGLSALWNARFPDIAARSTDEFRSPDGVIAWVTRSLAGG